MSYPDKATPESFRLVPEAATGTADRLSLTRGPTRSPCGRVSDSATVGLSGRARSERAIDRVLKTAHGLSLGPASWPTLVGAADVRARRKRPRPPASPRAGTRLPFASFDLPPPSSRAPRCRPCAPSRRRSRSTRRAGRRCPGRGPATSPIKAADERIVIRRNRFYGGNRPHHVDRFDVDLRAASPRDMGLKIDRNEADWGHQVAPSFFDPSIETGSGGSMGSTASASSPSRASPSGCSCSTPRGHYPVTTPSCDARSTSRSTALPLSGGPIATRTDQYLPYAMPGFSDADIYPLAGSDLGRAKELARGNTRGGKVVMYTTDFPPPIATAMAVRQELAEIGLDVEVKAIPEHIASAAYAGQLARPGEPWDIAPRALGAADPRPVRVPERAPRHRVHRRHEPRRIRVDRDRREPSPGRPSASGTGASTNVRRDGRWPRQN